MKHFVLFIRNGHLTRAVCAYETERGARIAGKSKRGPLHTNPINGGFNVLAFESYKAADSYIKDFNQNIINIHEVKL